MSRANLKDESVAELLAPALPLCLLLALSTSPARGDETVQRFMKNFSVSFAGLEEGLKRGDARAVSKHAALLRCGAAGLPEALSPAREIARSSAIAFGRKIESLSAETAELAERGELGDAGEALEELRHNCVSCHLKNRAENSPDRFFPARGNTIYGRVRILDSSGREREQGSEVVVFLDGFPAGAGFRLPRKRPSVSQKNREFSPRVLPVLKGSTVDFPNDDKIFHNVFSLSRARPFDLDIYESGESRSVTFTDSGLVTTYCNIHSNMVCHILVLENPFFTVTDDSGFFVICGVPDGSYALRSWHRLGGATRQEISVSGDGLFPVSTIVIRESKRTLDHRNKFGKPYREHYK